MVALLSKTYTNTEGSGLNTQTLFYGGRTEVHSSTQEYFSVQYIMNTMNIMCGYMSQGSMVIRCQSSFVNQKSIDIQTSMFQCAVSPGDLEW